MSAAERGELTAMLSEVRAGCPDAKDRLIRAIYGELLRTAQGLMRHERRDHTLDPGALVHEAVLRLLGGDALAEISDGATSAPLRLRRCARCSSTMPAGATLASARANAPGCPSTMSWRPSKRGGWT